MNKKKKRESVNIELNLEAEKAIKKLEKIKQLLQDISKLDMNFNLSNVLEVNNDSVLIFNCKRMLTREYKEETEKRLLQKLQIKCVLLNEGVELDKAINNNSENFT